MKRLRADWRLALVPLGLALVARGVAHLQALTEEKTTTLADLDARIAARLGQLDEPAEGVNTPLTVAET